jgi:hypothetical protein
MPDPAPRRSNQQTAFALLKRLTGDSNLMSVPRAFIQYTGSVEGGLLLSQILYWSDRGGNGGGWFYKSYTEWEEELCLTQYQVNRIVKLLKERGVLETKLKRAGAAPKIHYRLDMAAFTDSIMKFLDNRKIGLSSNSIMDYEETQQSDYEVSSQTYTETTQRLQAETTKGEAAHDAAPPAPEVQGLPLQERNNRNGTAKAAPSSAPPPADHPNIAIYREVCRNKPNLTQQELIAEARMDSEEWRTTCKAWMAKGYSPRNVSGLLDSHTNRTTGRRRAGPEEAAVSPLDFTTLTLEQKRAIREGRTGT